jgi:hypothetical protein
MKQTVKLRPGTTQYGMAEMIRDARITGALGRVTIRHSVHTIIETNRVTIKDDWSIDFYFSRDVRGYSDDFMSWEISGPTRAEVEAENAEFDRQSK